MTLGSNDEKEKRIGMQVGILSSSQGRADHNLCRDIRQRKDRCIIGPLLFFDCKVFSTYGSGFIS